MKLKQAQLTALAALTLLVAAIGCPKKNHPPASPAKPSGPTAGTVGALCTFSTSATDEDGDSLAIRFAWGDGDTSAWSQFIASGGMTTAQHSYAATGTHSISAQAEDRREALSGWSEPAGITIALPDTGPIKAPARPTGPASGEVGVAYDFTTLANGGATDSISIRFDWGDGDTCSWSSSVHGGDSLVLAHVFYTAGTFAVVAQAKRHDTTSDWSQPWSISITTTGNHPPSTPAAPTGPASGRAGSTYDFEASSTDPDNDSVSIRFDWGSGGMSNWSPLVASGQSVTMGHSWAVPGSYLVRAQARDKPGAVSNWSPAHTVVIGTSSLPAPVAVYTPLTAGETLRLTWTAVSGAQGYVVHLDDSAFQTTGYTFDVASPKKVIQVAAYDQQGEGDAWTINTSVVVTQNIVVYGRSDSGQMNHGFGFDVSGMAIPLDFSNPANFALIDYIMEDSGVPVSFYSPDAYTPPYNTKVNGSAPTATLDFDALRTAPGPGVYSNKQEVAVLGVYSLWMAASSNGWSPNDHFAKVQVENVSGTAVTLKLGYQKIGGLRWLISP